MKITIFWTGYVWLVSGTCLAEVWHDVMCIDVDQNKIDNLEKWIIPIYEPWLEELVVRNHREKRLLFTTNARLWVEFGEAIFSAVGTPPDENHKADLKHVKQVAQTVWKYMSEHKVFINKSTVPVGTGDACREIIQKELEKKTLAKPLSWILTPSQEQGATTELSFDVVSNPEFLKEWVAVRDFMLPDRIVCWVESEYAKKIMSEIYKPFVRTSRPLIFTDIKSAEIIKYAANSFLATKISFINEIANFAEITWGNISDISKWLWLDDRIWSRFLHAGIWYWWSCFPKDVQALIETGKDFNYDFKIIQATEAVNEVQKTILIDKLLKHIPDLQWKTITIWGLSFKPKTDDIRDAPSIAIIDRLSSLWVKEIKVFDPVANINIKKHYNWSNIPLSYYTNNYEALNSSDALLLVTEWDAFRMVDFKKVKEPMRWNLIIDGRNIWNKDDAEKEWLTYISIWK